MAIRLISILCFFVATTTVATAQPALTTPTPQLTADERALLARGEIGEGARVGGIVASVAFGLGTGHAIQGRWMERGWIFTFGELAGLGLGAVASSESDIDARTVNVLGFVGLATFIGLHVWEIVDASSVPEQHSCRVRELRRRASQAPVVALPFVTNSCGRGRLGHRLVV